MTTSNDQQLPEFGCNNDRCLQRYDCRWHIARERRLLARTTDMYSNDGTGLCYHQITFVRSVSSPVAAAKIRTFTP